MPLHALASEISPGPSSTQAMTLVPNLLEHTTPTGSSTPGANAATFTIAIVEHTIEVNSVLLRVDSSAGNICVGVYDDDGTGGGPGTRLATSGSVACPAASANGSLIAIPATTLTPGRYWAAMVLDGAATILYNALGHMGALGTLRYDMAAAFPLPATAVASAGTINAFWLALART